MAMNPQQVILCSDAGSQQTVLVRQKDGTFRVWPSTLPPIPAKSSIPVLPNTLPDVSANTCLYLPKSDTLTSESTKPPDSSADDGVSYTPGILLKKNQSDGSLTALSGTLVGTPNCSKNEKRSVTDSLSDAVSSHCNRIAPAGRINVTISNPPERNIHRLNSSVEADMDSCEAYYAVTADTGTVQETHNNFSSMSIPLKNSEGRHDLHVIRHATFKKSKSSSGIESVSPVSSSCQEPLSPTIDLTPDNDSYIEADTELTDSDQVRPVLLFTHEAASQLSGTNAENCNDWTSTKQQTGSSNNGIGVTKVRGVSVLKVGNEEGSKAHPVTKKQSVRPPISTNIENHKNKAGLGIDKSTVLTVSSCVTSYASTPSVVSLSKVNAGATTVLSSFMQPPATYIIPQQSASPVAGAPVLKEASVNDHKSATTLMLPATFDMAKSASIPLIFSQPTVPSSTSNVSPALNPTSILKTRDEVINFLTTSQPNTATKLVPAALPIQQASLITPETASSVISAVQPQVVSEFPTQNTGSVKTPTISELSSVKLHLSSPVSLPNVNYQVATPVLPSDGKFTPKNVQPPLALGVAAPTTIFVDGSLQRSMATVPVHDNEMQSLKSIDVSSNTRQPSMLVPLGNPGSRRVLLPNSINFPIKQMTIPVTVTPNKSNFITQEVQKSSETIPTTSISTSSASNEVGSVTATRSNVLLNFGPTMGPLLSSQNATYIIPSSGTNSMHLGQTATPVSSNPDVSTVNANVHKKIPSNLVGIANSKNCIMTQSPFVPNALTSNIRGIAQARTTVIPAQTNARIPVSLIPVDVRKRAPSNFKENFKQTPPTIPSSVLGVAQSRPNLTGVGSTRNVKQTPPTIPSTVSGVASSRPNLTDVGSTRNSSSGMRMAVFLMPVTGKVKEMIDTQNRINSRLTAISNQQPTSTTSVHSTSKSKFSKDNICKFTGSCEESELNTKVQLDRVNADLEREKYLLEHCRKIERDDMDFCSNTARRVSPQKGSDMSMVDEQKTADSPDFPLLETACDSFAGQRTERKEPLILKRTKKIPHGGVASACLIAAARNYLTSKLVKEETTNCQDGTTLPKMWNENDTSEDFTAGAVDSSQGDESSAVGIRIDSVFSLSHQDDETQHDTEQKESSSSNLSLQAKFPKKKKRGKYIDLSYIKRRRKRIIQTHQPCVRDRQIEAEPEVKDTDDRTLHSHQPSSKDSQIETGPEVKDTFDTESSCKSCSVAIHKLDLRETVAGVGEINKISDICSQTCRQHAISRMLLKNRTERSFETALRECFADKKPRYEIFDTRTLLVSEEELFGCRRSRRIKTTPCGGSRENSPAVEFNKARKANVQKRPNTESYVDNEDGKSSLSHSGILPVEVETDVVLKINSFNEDRLSQTGLKKPRLKISKKRKHGEKLLSTKRTLDEKQTVKSISPITLGKSVSAKPIYECDSGSNKVETNSESMECTKKHFPKREKEAGPKVFGDIRGKNCVVFQVGDNNFILPVTTGANSTEPRAFFVGFDSVPSEGECKTSPSFNSVPSTSAIVTRDYGKSPTNDSEVERFGQSDTTVLDIAKIKTEPVDTYSKPVVFDDNHGDHEEKIRRLKEVLQEKQKLIKKLKTQKDFDNIF